MTPLAAYLTILIGCYVGGFLLGSWLLRTILLYIDESLNEFIHTKGPDFHDAGFWIGLCEHFLIVTFIILGEYAAFALIIAAKEIVRTEKIKTRPNYYLLGTLLSISFAVLFGLIARLLIQAAR